MEGYGPYQISKLLSEAKVEIPAVHLARFHEGVNRTKPVKDPYGWGSSTIVNILKKRNIWATPSISRPASTSRTRKATMLTKASGRFSRIPMRPSSTRKPLTMCSASGRNVRRYPDGWGEAHPLTGLMYCADCGGKMYVHRVNNGKRDPQFTCSQYSKIPYAGRPLPHTAPHPGRGCPDPDNRYAPGHRGVF